MKTYLLICFILLFYSIYSVTEKDCKIFTESCDAHCQNYTLPSQINCNRFCFRKSIECYQRAKNGMDFP